MVLFIISSDTRLIHFDFKPWRDYSDLILICKEGFVDDLLPKEANYHHNAFKIPVYGNIESNSVKINKNIICHDSFTLKLVILSLDNNCFIFSCDFNNFIF